MRATANVLWPLWDRDGVSTTGYSRPCAQQLKQELLLIAVWSERAKASPLRHIAGTDRTLTLPSTVPTPRTGMRPAVISLSDAAEVMASVHECAAPCGAPRRGF